MNRERDFFVDRVDGYFASMDRGDVDGTVACFAPDATLTCESNDMRLSGHEEIRSFFERITSNTHEMVHEVTGLVVDEAGGRCAAELNYRNRRKVGDDIDMAVCDFFDFDDDGKFSRVRFWTSGVVVPAASVQT
jgi:ketosteroid isomerase-like protein